MSTRNIENLKSAVVRKNKRITELESQLTKVRVYFLAACIQAGDEKVSFYLDKKLDGFAQTPRSVITEIDDLIE